MNSNNKTALRCPFSVPLAADKQLSAQPRTRFSIPLALTIFASILLVSMSIFLSNPLYSILSLLIFITALFVHSYLKHRSFPPGPFHLPIIGNGHLFFNCPNPTQVVLNLRQKYGPVFTLALPHPTIILAHGDALKKMGELEALEGRPGGFVWSYFTRNKATGSGIILAEGPEHRALKHLAGQMTRGFNGTPNVLVARVEEYVDILIGSLQELVNKSSPSNPDKAIVSTVSSIIDSFVFGDLDSCTASWKDNLDAILKNVAAPQTQLINSYPLLRFCPVLNRTFTKFVKAGNAINTELGSRVAARRQMSTVSEHDDQLPEDFIQAALKQNKSYSDTTLITSTGDLWTGGLSTTVTLLRWALIYLVHHPNVQTRLREEVLEAFGQSMPNYKEKEKTPYFLATIRELLRLVNVLPYGIPHRASKDVTMVVEGKTYFIPKGATVFPIYGVTNFDPNVFPEPYSFNPDRFLNTFHSDFSNPQNFFPFGAGRRRCAGSSLAYIELYVLLGRIMQFFEIHPEDGKLPSLRRSPGMTNEPLPFKVVLKNVPGPGTQEPV